MYVVKNMYKHKHSYIYIYIYIYSILEVCPQLFKQVYEVAALLRPIYEKRMTKKKHEIY